MSPEGLPGLTETIAGIEKSLIDAALRKAAGNQARAAQFLGIPRTTLRDKMAKYGMGGQTTREQPSA
jgi:two-component system C4-dicarboxylate transport response regulator DctD